MSIRAGSWFEQSKMMLEENYTYWWCQDLDETQKEINLDWQHTGVDWYSFCREVCKTKLMEDSGSIGGGGREQDHANR